LTRGFFGAGFGAALVVEDLLFAAGGDDAASGAVALFVCAVEAVVFFALAAFFGAGFSSTD
jgi:hypothetical protein